MTQGPNSSSHAPLKVGDKLGRYDIVAQIGAGGTAIVWKGHDNLLDKYAAIKQLLPPDSEWENAREKFIREAETLKRVSRSSKHTVQILDTVNESRGMFILMEFVDGQSLEQMLAAHPEPINERQALGIVGGIALALEAIHNTGILHRDIKPSNILLPKVGGLKVVDFGVSTFFENQETMDAGTARYMAPELYNSDTKADARADIYSLGFIAYEMLAGRAKFEEAFRIILKDQRNASLRWMKWHMNPRVKPTPLNQLNPAISQTLSDLVMRMIEKDPTQRISSPQELITAIRRHFSGEKTQPVQPTVSAAPLPASAMASMGDKTAPIKKKSNKLLLILAAALVAVSVIGFGALGLIEQQKKAAVVAELKKQGQASYLELSKRFVELDKRSAELNSKAEVDKAEKQAVSNDYAALAADYKELSAQWAADPDLGKPAQARGLIAEAKAASELDKYTEAQEALEKADTLGITSNRERIDSLATELKRRAAFGGVADQIREYIVNQEFALARGLITEQRRRSLTPYEAKIVDDIATRLEDQLMQAQINRIVASAKSKADAGNRAEAISELTEARKTYKNPAIEQYLDTLVKARDHAATLEAAAAAESRSDWAKAIEAYTRALNYKPDPAISEKINVYRYRMALEEARRFRSQGNMAAAADKYREAQNIRPSDEAQRELDEILRNADREKLVAAGLDAMNRKDYDSAIKSFQNALQIKEDAELRNRIRTMQVETLINTAIANLQQGKLDAARATLDQADQLSPGNTLSVRVRESINRRSDYERFRDAGDRARADSNFIDAKAAYIRARETIKDMTLPETKKEIETRLDDVEFDHLMAQARSQISSFNWDSAKALLGAANSRRSTDEVVELLKQVETKIKERDAIRDNR